MTAAANNHEQDDPRSRAEEGPVGPQRLPEKEEDPQPSRLEVLLLTLCSAGAFWSVLLACHRGTAIILHYGDNGAYFHVATAISQWKLAGANIQHFMGYPYCIALCALVFRIPIVASLWMVAACFSVLSVLLVERLFGAWVAGYFALTNFAWLQLSFIGGSEPLAVALGLGSMLCFRRQRTLLAALLGSVAVLVRPLMIFVLIGIGLELLYRRQYRKFSLALLTGLAVGILYMLPLALYLGDPLWTVHSYLRRDYGAATMAGEHGHLFGWPLHGIIVGTITYSAPSSNLLLSGLWIVSVLAGLVFMFAKRYRDYAEMYPNEAIFAGLYLLAVFCYDYELWARSNFMRFVIPALPFIFYSLAPYLPKDRRVLWGLSVVGGVLAGVSAVGVRTVVR